MKIKINILISLFLLIILLACNTLTRPPTGISFSQTQETFSPSTTAPTFTKTPTSVAVPPDYFFLDDAYNSTANEDGDIEFYTNKSFEYIHDYYIKELPLHGYSEVTVEGRDAPEGCFEIFFSGDPSGKMLVVTSCIIFQTEEHWISIGFIDK